VPGISRRLYVTHEEFERLQQLGKEDSVREALFTALPFRSPYSDDFGAKVSELLGVDLETLRKFTWRVEVVDTVAQRLGRDWTSR